MAGQTRQARLCAKCPAIVVFPAAKTRMAGRKPGMTCFAYLLAVLEFKLKSLLFFPE
jgi:hypothetical protein